MKFSISREWKIFGLVLLGCLGISAFVFTFSPDLRQLIIFFFFTILANSFTFVPYEPALLYHSKLYLPLWLALLGGVGTSLAGFLDYQAVTYLFGYRKMAAIRKNKYYLLVANYFRKVPFACLVITGFTPVPFHPVKFMAIATAYPLQKYLLALFVGRTPRYYLVALVGKGLQISNWVILLIFLIFILWEIMAYKIVPRPIQIKKKES
ncbi:MAG: VTT domain-containing protein [Candidatus Zixiibacteriota bacterium]